MKSSRVFDELFVRNLWLQRLEHYREGPGGPAGGFRILRDTLASEPAMTAVRLFPLQVKKIGSALWGENFSLPKG
jgi:hypothetical protein